MAEILARSVHPAHAGEPEVARDSANQLVAEFYNVNGLVRVTLVAGEHRIRIETFRSNIWHFLDNAHATTIAGETRDGAVRAWAWYIELSIWSLMAMALSGLWLGLASRWRFVWTRVSIAVGCLAFGVLWWLER